MMKQVQIHAYGSAEVLKPMEVNEPKPKPGEVLINVETIGVNYSDILRRRNEYFLPTPLPYVLGTEAVGEVVALGEGVNVPGVEIGARVLAALPSGGGYAECVAAPAHFCIPLPSNIASVDATAIFVQGSTAYLILYEVAKEMAGKTILVHAAAGGVGSLLVQLAKLGGAKVIAAASSTEKLDVARVMGADAGVDYTKADWTAKVIAASGGEKVDLVLEMVGGEIYTQSFDCLKQGGTMIVYGAASGQKGLMHSEHFVDESHNLLSFNLAHFIKHKAQAWQAGLGALIGLLAEGKLRVRVDHQFALAEVATAHRQIEERLTTGKVVLIP